MIFAGDDNDGIAFNPVDQSVFLIDSTRPIALEFVFERLGLSESGVRLAKNIQD